MSAYPLGLCKNPWEWFDSIKVINLPQRTDRLMECKAEFKRVSLKHYEIVKPEPAICPQLSLILTNLKILKQAKQDGVEKLLILEDDVTFIGEWKQNLLSTINDIHYTGWKMLYLGASVNRKLPKVYPNTVRLNNTLATHAVAYHANSYDHIICELQARSHAYSNPLDVIYALRVQPVMEVYMCCPMVAIQRESYSDIENKQVYYPMDQWFEQFNS